MEQFLIDRNNFKRELFKKSKRNIHNDLPEGYCKWEDVPKDLSKKIKSKRNPSDSKLANWLGLKISNVNKEVLETKRLLVEINKFIKSNETIQ